MKRKMLWKHLSFSKDGFYDTRTSKLTFPWQNALVSMVSVLLIQISLSLEIMIDNSPSEAAIPLVQMALQEQILYTVTGPQRFLGSIGYHSPLLSFLYFLCVSFYMVQKRKTYSCSLGSLLNSILCSFFWSETRRLLFPRKVMRFACEDCVHFTNTLSSVLN